MFDLLTVKYATGCPSTMVYTYGVQSGMQSCRCHSDPDFTCAATFDPVDGCVCADGTYLDDSGNCVPLNKCSCYYKGSVIPPTEVISKDGTMWCVWFTRAPSEHALTFVLPSVSRKSIFK